MNSVNYPLHWTNDHKWWYWNVYLESDHWKQLRAEKLKSSPRCETCGSKDRIEPHHLNYKNLFDVQLSDLKTLCRKCHNEYHKIHGMPRRSLGPLRKSQKEFPESAKQNIILRATEKLQRTNHHIQKLIDANKPIPKSI